MYSILSSKLDNIYVIYKLYDNISICNAVSCSRLSTNVQALIQSAATAH